MTIFWDQGRDAEQLRAAAHRNGHDTVVRLDFTIDVRHVTGRAILSVAFDELDQTATKAIAYRSNYIQPIQPGAWESSFAPDELIVNICRFLDQQCPEDCTWSYDVDIPIDLSYVPNRSVPLMPGTPAGLAPITDINIRLRK